MARPTETAETRSVRLLRVGEQVRHALSDILTRGEVHDETLASHAVTITEVRMAPDLCQATCFVKALLGKDEEAVIKALRTNTAYLQREVAARVQMKYAAKLKFLADESFDEGSHIDQLLRERDPARRPLARLYLQLLALGFQGRYRGADSLAPIAAYRRELFQFAWQRMPDLQGRRAVLTDQPYASTLTDGGQARISRASRRTVRFVAAMAVLLAVSEAMWLWPSWEVRAHLDHPAPAERQAAS